VPTSNGNEIVDFEMVDTLGRGGNRSADENPIRPYRGYRTREEAVEAALKINLCVGVIARNTEILACDCSWSVDANGF